MCINQYLYLTALQQHAKFKNYYTWIKSQGQHIQLTVSSSAPEIFKYRAELKADALQLLGEENLYCSYSHVCQDIHSLTLFLGLVHLGFFVLGVFFPFAFFTFLLKSKAHSLIWIQDISDHTTPQEPLFRDFMKLKEQEHLKNASHSLLCKHELSEIAKHMNYYDLVLFIFKWILQHAYNNCTYVHIYTCMYVHTHYSSCNKAFTQFESSWNSSVPKNTQAFRFCPKFQNNITKFPFYNWWDKAHWNL